MYYEMKKTFEGETIFTGGDFNLQELIQAEMEGWLVLQDVPKRKARKKETKHRKTLAQKYREVNWDIFEQLKV